MTFRMDRSAQNAEPPGEAKQALIRRYLVASGDQHRIDSGAFLDRYVMPGSPLFASAAAGGATIAEAASRAKEALMAAYGPHRAVWQEEYESHLNWEYDEPELGLIVVFLESDAGQHYLEGAWRMGAYAGTNTEFLIDEIIGDAIRVMAAKQT